MENTANNKHQGKKQKTSPPTLLQKRNAENIVADVFLIKLCSITMIMFMSNWIV